MKKLAMIFTMLFSVSALAVGPAPEFLKGGVITVTLKNGKTYTYSADEYAVVKRGEDSPKKEVESTKKEVVSAPEVRKSHDNIVSVGLVRGQKGFDMEQTASTVDVTTKKEVGVQLQLQRRVSDKVYVGGQADTNGSIGASVGVGF